MTDDQRAGAGEVSSWRTMHTALWMITNQDRMTLDIGPQHYEEWVRGLAAEALRRADASGDMHRRASDKREGEGELRDLLKSMTKFYEEKCEAIYELARLAGMPEDPDGNCVDEYFSFIAEHLRQPKPAGEAGGIATVYGPSPEFLAEMESLFRENHDDVTKAWRIDQEARGTCECVTSFGGYVFNLRGLARFITRVCGVRQPLPTPPPEPKTGEA